LKPVGTRNALSRAESAFAVGPLQYARVARFTFQLPPLLSNLLTIRAIILGIAAIPFIYYGIAIFSSLRFFLRARSALRDFLPPVSILKPVRGLDPEAYENFASFCRQDYPQFEILFCVGDSADPALPVIRQLKDDFPGTRIGIVIGTGRNATNDKVAKLARLVEEAAYEHLVINDSDVRVEPHYLRRIIAPMAGPGIGAVTCFYVPTHEANWVQRLQDVGMLSDFYPGILVAWQLDGVKFALGPTICTTKSRLQEFSGYGSIENKPADDLWIGRLIAESGSEVVLLPYSISTVPDYQSFSELFAKRLRWITVMRHMRPWGHAGLVFTLGLPWALLAVAIEPTVTVAAAYLGGYFLVRCILTLLVGSVGLKQRGVWAKLGLIPLWDAIATGIWLTSFTRRSIRWRGYNYSIVDGNLVPAKPILAKTE
jgi:ceramide glucosyltransferase